MVTRRESRAGQGKTDKDGAMSGKQNGPQYEAAPLITSAAMVGGGVLIALVGLAIGGGHLVTATRRWVDEMEVPPSELARLKWSQARSAYAAGAAAWQNGSRAGVASAS
jgi:hypothetical protein